MTDTAPRILLIWPYGIVGAESIPMCMSYLVPQINPFCDVLVLDCSLNNIHPTSDKFAQVVREISPDVIGISSWSQNWRWVGRTIDNLRDVVPNAPIVLGGPHVTATGDVGKADYAMLGEAEYTFPELIRALGQRAGQDQLEQIKGLRHPGMQLYKAPQALVTDLDALGLPDFNSMGLKPYQQHGYRYRTGVQLQAPVLATRGCPYSCEFCEAPMLSGRKIRKHSIGYLKELLLYLRTDYDVTHINIVDDNFSFYPAYVIEFCEMVLATDKLKGMTFATPNGLRVERSNAEMFLAMKRAGWERVIFAPESGSQRMVDIMAKGLDLGVVPGRVEMAQTAGLEVEAFFIMNYPGETPADVQATGDFIATVPFDAISLHIFKPLPHTPIWRELVDSGKLAPEYVIGRYDEVDWLANGLDKLAISQMIDFYSSQARSIYRVA